MHECSSKKMPFWALKDNAIKYSFIGQHFPQILADAFRLKVRLAAALLRCGTTTLAKSTACKCLLKCTQDPDGQSALRSTPWAAALASTAGSGNLTMVDVAQVVQCFHVTVHIESVSEMCIPLLYSPDDQWPQGVASSSR